MENGTPNNIGKTTQKPISVSLVGIDLIAYCPLKLRKFCNSYLCVHGSNGGTHDEHGTNGTHGTHGTHKFIV